MAKTLQTASDQATRTQGVTLYYQAASNTVVGDPIEANRQVSYRSPGKLITLSVNILSNNIPATSTAQTRINGTNGTLLVTVPANSTGMFSDTSHSDTIASGDLVCTVFTTGTAGSGNLILGAISTTFSANTNTVQIFGGGKQTFGTNGATRVFKVGGTTLYTTANEAQAQYKMQTAGTVKNGFIYVDSNGRSNATTFISRNNGVNGNLSIVVAGGATGVFEDTVNTDTIAVGDLWCWQVTTLSGGAGTISWQSYKISFETTDKTSQYCAVPAGTSTAISVGTRYSNVSGQIGIGTTESDFQIPTFINSTFSLLQMYVGTNANSATSIVNFRKGGTNGNSNLSIPAAATGWFIDSINTDSVGPNDLVDYQFVVSGGGQVGIESLGGKILEVQINSGALMMLGIGS